MTGANGRSLGTDLSRRPRIVCEAPVSAGRTTNAVYRLRGRCRRGFHWAWQPARADLFRFDGDVLDPLVLLIRLLAPPTPLPDPVLVTQQILDHLEQERRAQTESLATTGPPTRDAVQRANLE
jgi:hypothetical protein